MAVYHTYILGAINSIRWCSLTCMYYLHNLLFILNFSSEHNNFMFNYLLANSTLESLRHLKFNKSNMPQLSPRIQTFVSLCNHFLFQREGLELSLDTSKFPWPKKSLELLHILPKIKCFPVNHDPSGWGRYWCADRNVGHCKTSYLNLLLLVGRT